MEQKKHSDFCKTIVDFLMMIPNIFEMIHDATDIAAKKAKKYLTILVSFSFLMAILLTSIWLSALAILITYLKPSSPMMSVSILFGLNLLLIICVCVAICKHKKNLLFRYTVAQCQRLKAKVHNK